MRITKGLIWLILSFGLFFGGAILANRMGWLPASVQKDGEYATWFEMGMRIVATVAIGPPVAFFIFALFSAGTDKAIENRQGMTVMHLRSGARIFGAFLSWALAALFVLGPYLDGGPIISLLLAPFALFFLVAGLFCLIARVSYDNYELYAIDYLFRAQRYNWSDLQRITYVPEQHEFHLLFDGDRKARISSFYAGVYELIALADRKLPHA